MDPWSIQATPYSYDIFSQAADALRRPKAINPLGGLTFGRCSRPGDRSGRSRGHLHQRGASDHASVRRHLVHSRGANASGSEPKGSRGKRRTRWPGAHLRTDVDVPSSTCRRKATWSPCAPISAPADRSHTTAGGDRRRAHAETPRWVARNPAAARHGSGLKDPVKQRAASRGVKAARERVFDRWVRDGARRRSRRIELAHRSAAADPIAAMLRQREGRHPSPRARSANRDRRPGANTVAQEAAAGAPANFASSLDGRSCSTAAT